MTLIAAIHMTLNEISENPSDWNKSFTTWVEDGTPTDLNIYGNKQPDKVSYSVFNGMLKLVISKDELIDEIEFNQIADNTILKVYIRHSANSVTWNHQFQVPKSLSASIWRKSNYNPFESILGKYEYEELKFYEKNCVKGLDNDEFIKVFKSETGQLKHICLIERENSKSIFLQ